VHFSGVAIGRIDASPCVTGRHAPVQRERNEPQSHGLSAKCAFAGIGRGLCRVRCVAECYRLLAQNRVRLILEGTIICDED
jgi:hypothetical protein